MKKAFVAMIVIAIMLVGGLTYIGFSLKSKNKDYYNLENKLMDSAKVYCGQYPGLLQTNNLTLSSEKLIGENFLDNLNHGEEACVGYVVVSKNGIAYDYKPFIKCPNYETKKYDASKNEGVS